MFNPYTIILGLFVVTGFIVTVWGIRILMLARKTRQWPSVEGIIESCEESTDENDLLPRIEFSYVVGQQSFRQTLKFPADISPTQEFARHYVDKYTVGTQTPVFYDPHNPKSSTLEPGLARGDWLVLGTGAGMLVLGIVMLFFTQ